MLAHEFKNVSKAKSQNQWSFRVGYHSFPESFVASTLLSEINTFVNTIVRQLMDLTDLLSTPEIGGKQFRLILSDFCFRGKQSNMCNN